jgi:hypothetical protein
MSTFPKLKTGAVAQYPAQQTDWYRNQTLRFLDGATQGYRDSARPLRRWSIRLDQLDETEMAALEQFFSDSEGRYCNFAFTDPWDRTVYPNCSLSSDELDLTWQAEMRGGATLTVTENRA